MFGNGTDAGMTMPHIPCFDHDAHPPMFVDIDLDLHLWYIYIYIMIHYVYVYSHVCKYNNTHIYIYYTHKRKYTHVWWLEQHKEHGFL